MWKLPPGVEKFYCTSALVWGSGDVEDLLRVLCYDSIADNFDHVGDGVVDYSEGVHRRVVAVTCGEVPESDRNIQTRCPSLFFGSASPSPGRGGDQL